MAEFRKAYDVFRPLEGYYANVPPDDETYGGVNRKWFPHCRIWTYVDNEKPLKNNQKLKSKKAEDILMVFYYVHFWQEANYYALDSDAIATLLFSQYVNSGNDIIKSVQSVLNLKIDGVMGPVTTATINAYQNPKELFDLILKKEQERYRELVEKIPEDKKFLRGWLDRLERIKIAVGL